MKTKLFSKILITTTCLLIVAVMASWLFTERNLMQSQSSEINFLAIEKETSQQVSGMSNLQKSKTWQELDTLSLADIQKAANLDDPAMRYDRQLEPLKLNELAMTGTEATQMESEKAATDETITLEEEIPFETLEFYADWVEPGESVITIVGRNGKAAVTYQNKYSPLGKLIEQIEVSREILVEPVRQEVAISSAMGNADLTGAETTDSEVMEEPGTNTGESEYQAKEDAGTEVPTETDPAPEPTQPIATDPEPTEPIPADLEPTEPVSPVPSGSDIEFVAAGSNQAAYTNHALIAGLLKANGNASYNSYTVNDNNTITVDGVTFAYDYTTVSTITGYDGLELNSYTTASGMRTTRGIVATVFPKFGGYPFGTVLFIDGFGLVVVADYNGMGEVDASWLDVCFYDGETIDGRANPGRTTKTVYVLSMP